MTGPVTHDQFIRDALRRLFRQKAQSYRERWDWLQIVEA